MEELFPGDLNWCKLQLSECRTSIYFPLFLSVFFEKASIQYFTCHRNKECLVWILCCRNSYQRHSVTEILLQKKVLPSFPLPSKKGGKKVPTVVLLLFLLCRHVWGKETEKLSYSLLPSSRWFPSKPLVGGLSEGYGTFSVDSKKFYQWVIGLTVLLQRYKCRIYLKKVIKHFQHSLLFAWFCKTGILKCNSRM